MRGEGVEELIGPHPAVCGHAADEQQRFAVAEHLGVEDGTGIGRDGDLHAEMVATQMTGFRDSPQSAGEIAAHMLGSSFSQ